MITICLRCGHTSDNLDTHDEHQTASGHKDWAREDRRVPRPLRAPCPSCGATVGVPCMTAGGRERRNYDIHESRWRQLILREKAGVRA